MSPLFLLFFILCTSLTIEEMEDVLIQQLNISHLPDSRYLIKNTGQFVFNRYEPIGTTFTESDYQRLLTQMIYHEFLLIVEEERWESEESHRLIDLIAKHLASLYTPDESSPKRMVWYYEDVWEKPLSKYYHGSKEERIEAIGFFYLSVQYARRHQDK